MTSTEHQAQTPEPRTAVELSPTQDFVAGAAGGVCECLSGHPLDTVKVRLQTSTNTTASGSVWGTFRSIAEAEGIKGLYRGVSSPLAGLILINACMFSSYEAATRALERAEGRSHLSLPATFIAGCTSGAFTTIVESPVDLVKVQLQRQRVGQRTLYGGYFDCWRHILTVGGLPGMYQGATATFARNVPGQGCHFVADEATVRLLGSQETGDSTDALPVAVTLAAGSVAGLALWVSTYPFDVVKTMLQDQPLKSSERDYAGLRDCVRKVMQKHGTGRLWAGFNACVVRSVPSTAVCFLGYEQASAVLRSNNMLV